MTLDPDIEARLRVIEVPSTLHDAKRPEEMILSEVERHRYSEDATFAIKLALEEAMTNAVKHGNRNDPTKKIVVRYCVTPQQAVIIVRDEGVGFEPDCVPDPTLPERICLPNGRGIMLIRAYMNDVLFAHNGTEVCMIKRNE